MPSLSSGSSVTLAVQAGQSVTVYSDQVDYRFENPVGTVVVVGSSDRTFGPLNAPTNVKLTAISGTVSYEQTPVFPVSVADTLGVRLRRLARAAEASNPLINPPWTKAPDWVASTAYIQGDVRVNGGKLYVCVTNGTSAASGGPTATNGNSQADDTAAWTYYGRPQVTADDAMAPALTISTASTSGLTNVFTPVAYPEVFGVYGGYATTFATNYWRMYAFSRAAGSFASGGIRVAFEFEDDKLDIGFGNSTAGVRVIIDDRDYSPGNITPATGATPTYLKFDFSSTSGWKRRKVVVESFKGGSGFDFCGVRVSPTGAVWAPPAQDDVTVACISDSIFAGSGYGPMLSGNAVHGRLGKLLGWNNCWSFSEGGTGYIAAGAGPYYTYGQRIAEALTRNPDLWVFMGSTNDIGETAEAITAAALAAFQAIRAGGSTAPIIVLGVWPINNASVPTVETAVQSAVTQFNDSKTYFIPINGDAVLPWVTGAWNNTNNTSSVNAPMYIAGDNVHPADIGTAYLADRIANAIRTSVLPNIV